MFMLTFFLGKKKVALELGGNASCVVDQDADLENATSRVVFGAFYGYIPLIQTNLFFSFFSFFETNYI